MMKLVFRAVGMPAITIEDAQLPSGDFWRDRAEAAFDLVGPKLVPEYTVAIMYDAAGAYMGQWKLWPAAEGSEFGYKFTSAI